MEIHNDNFLRSQLDEFPYLLEDRVDLGYHEQVMVDEKPRQ